MSCFPLSSCARARPSFPITLIPAACPSPRCCSRTSTNLTGVFATLCPTVLPDKMAHSSPCQGKEGEEKQLSSWSFALIPLPRCGQRSLVVRNRKGFVQHIWPHQIMRRGPFDLREFLASDVVRPALAMLSPSGKPQNYCCASRTFLCSARTVAKACTDRIIARQR